MTPMLEMMENITSTQIIFESALQEYLDACLAFQKCAMVGEFPLAKLESFTSDELATFTSNEGKLQTTKAQLGDVHNHTKPVGSLPSNILSRIFHLVPLEPLSEGTLGYFRFPKRLEYISHTCSRWRQVALDTPSLWTYLCFAPQLVVNRSLISRATVYAARAGGLPLEIDITQYNYEYHSSRRTRCLTEDDPLPEFLTLVAHRISSIELCGVLKGSELYNKVLETCLAGATPGRLIRLDINRKSSPENIAIGSSQDSSQILDVALDVPMQRLDDVLSSVTSLSLQDARFPWVSKAFHGLVELQLGSDASSSANRSDVKIPESHLCGILSSSPGLRRLTFNMRVQESNSSDDPVTPVTLQDLVVLDLRGLDHSHLAAVLQLVAPGPGLSMLWLTLTDADDQDPHLNQVLKCFFGRANPPNLGLTFSFSLWWLETLSGLVDNLSVLVLQDVKISHASRLPVVQWEDTPTAVKFVDRLHLSRCALSLNPLKWIIDMCRPRTMTLWRCYDYEDPTEHWTASYSRPKLIPRLPQECPYINILQNDKLDPVWDWD